MSKEYNKHSRPNGRPIHPACTLVPGLRFGQQTQPCSCDKLWGGWDGTEESLDKLIAIAMRLELRCRASAEGDDLATYLENDARKAWDGFWSKANHLRCVAGKPPRMGELDMSRFKSLTWQRAAEANK